MQRLLITRCLPDSVVERARSRFDVTWRNEPTPLPPQDLRAAPRDYDATLVTLGDRFSADIFADVARPRARLLANGRAGTRTSCWRCTRTVAPSASSAWAASAKPSHVAAILALP